MGLEEHFRRVAEQRCPACGLVMEAVFDRRGGISLLCPYCNRFHPV